MTLEDIERKAGDIAGYCDVFGIVAEIINGAVTNQDVHDVAAALLAILPVARWADAWKQCEDRGGARVDGLRDFQLLDRLRDAIDTMRTEIGGEG